MGSNNFSFKFDARELERQMKKAAEPELHRIARQSQPVFDRLADEHGGEPVEDVLPHVRAAFRQLGWTADSEAELRQYAETIAEGGRIVLNVDASSLR